MKIEKFYNKKEAKEQYRARFQLNGREFRPVADSRRKLNEIIDELRASEHRAKYELPTLRYSPPVRELFARHLALIARPHQRVLAQRVFEKFLSELPEDITITEIRRAHFQKYIDSRLSEKTVQSKTPVTAATVKRELSIISAAWKSAPSQFPELDDFFPFPLPKVKVKRTRRETILPEKDFTRLTAYLYRPKESSETALQYFHRVRLAHSLEFALETGFRRKEIAALRFDQYDESEGCLVRVRRFKTDTETPFFPLSDRAKEIVKARRALQGEYIFTPDGRAVEANYRTLKAACRHLKINYGRRSGFVTHDLRHQFASEIIAVTDVETAKSLTGHKGAEILTYLHTTREKQKSAIQNRSKTAYDEELKKVFEAVKNEDLSVEKFIEKVRKICRI